MLLCVFVDISGGSWQDVQDHYGNYWVVGMAIQPVVDLVGLKVCNKNLKTQITAAENVVVVELLTDYYLLKSVIVIWA